MKQIGIVLLAAIAAGCGGGKPATLSIAAAADLQFALRDGAAQFEKAHPGVRISVVYGSSGNFFAQIQNHAPFDIYLSADKQYPQSLVSQGLAEGKNVFPYALGRIVVWVPVNSPLDPETAVSDPRVLHLAIANPDHAPYGQAAKAALQSMGADPSLQNKLVMGENISQALQFVQSGAADAGIVALSLAVAPEVKGQGRYWEIPASLYTGIMQSGVILKDSAAARDFRMWWTGASGQELLRRYGFSIPQ